MGGPELFAHALKLLCVSALQNHVEAVIAKLLREAAAYGVAGAGNKGPS